MRKDSIILTLLIFVLSILSFITFIYFFINMSAKDIINSTSSEYVSTIRKSSNQLQNSKPIGILLIGIDSDEQRSVTDVGRADSLIYVTINPLSQKIHLYSISRDMYVWTHEHTYQKINASYSIDGEKQTAQAVEKFLNAPVDYYISVNMNALVEIVNAIGGIEVNNKFDFPISIEEQEPEYTSKIEPGLQLINGEQALVYARMRYQDPTGDVGRQLRQQEVIMSIISKLKSGSIIFQYKKLSNIIKNNVKLSIQQQDIETLITRYSSSLKHVEMTSIIGRGESINGIYYMIAGKNNLLEIQNQIRHELELEMLSDIQDEKLLLVDDEQLELDTSIHYDFE